MYAIPYFDRRILKIDPDTDTVEFLPNPVPAQTSASTHFCGVLGPNNRIYCVPDNHGILTEIDPVTDKITHFKPNPNIPLQGSISGGGLNYCGGVLHPNGRIYFALHSANLIAELVTGWQVNSTDPIHNIPSDISTLPSSLYNKYHNYW